eukprot:COSAG04_NODE_377_length_15549_cov_118.825243_7_plen_39_part_00
MGVINSFGALGQRVLVLAAVLHLDYQHFEKQGGGEGGG